VIGSRHHRDQATDQFEQRKAGQEKPMNRRESLRAWSSIAALGELGAGSLFFHALGARAQGEADEARLLRAGACVVMLRHAQTDPGVGDPPEFDLTQCRTQRNLSEQGRAQAHRIGEWFNARQLQPRAVQSSAWCRCKDTADLAFGRHTVLPALSSTFGSSNAQPGQTQALRALLAAVPPGQFDVWVTHQVNITAFTGESPSMGEAIIVSKEGKALLKTRFG
jgi:Histidine phosphatase superfamily (branch 1)